MSRKKILKAESPDFSGPSLLFLVMPDQLKTSNQCEKLKLLYGYWSPLNEQAAFCGKIAFTWPGAAADTPTGASRPRSCYGRNLFWNGHFIIGFINTDCRSVGRFSLLNDSGEDFYVSDTTRNIVIIRIGANQ